MKRLLFILLITHCSLLIVNAQWMPMTNGMWNMTIYSLAGNGNNIFAGNGNYAVFLSTNNGALWTQTSLNDQTVYSLAANGSNVFAGAGAHVYKSTNNGTTWTQTSLIQEVRSLTANGNSIFAGTYGNGVYLSTNNGTTWASTSLNNRYVFSLAASGNNIFAGTNYGVYLSTDNGTNWSQTSLNNQFAYSLAATGDNIFAGTGGFGVYLSTNNGTSWTQTSLNNQYVLSLAVDGNNLFAGTLYNNGVYVSNDNGTIWIQRNEGLGNLVVGELCILNNFIFAGTDANGVYRRPLSDLIGIRPISEQIPLHYALEQNYPNPFNPTTKIRFSLPSVETIHELSLRVYDALGKEAAVLVNESLKPGTYEVEWNASNYPSGIYYYKLTSGDYAETKKMILIK